MNNPCDYCKLAEVQPDYSRYHAKCRGCAIRSLAQGPLFHASGVHGSLAAPYRTQLAMIFGDRWLEGHAEVKREHQRIKEARALL